LSSWKKYKLGEISTDVTYGYTESASRDAIGPKFLRITDIQNDHINWHDVPYCKIKPSDFEKYKLELGDIVVARTGNSTGATAVIKDDFKSVFASYLIRFKIDQKIADPFYIDFLMRSSKWKNFVESIKGGSAQPGANAKQFSEFEFLLPNLPTQTRIASILSSLDDKIELNRQMNQTLEEMAKSLFEKYFIDVIDEANLPEGWRLGTLGEITRNVRNGVSINNLKDEVAYIGLEHLPRKSLALNEIGTGTGLMSSKLTFKEDQILFGKLRPYFHKVILSPLSGVCSTDILVLEPIQLDFLSFCLFHLYSDALIDYSSKISAGTRMPRADWKGLSSYKIIIPPVSVAKEFNSKAYPMLSKIKCTFSENLAL